MRPWITLCALLALTGCSLPRWPVDGTLTSPYGLRMRGILPQIHRGVDVSAPAGRPVRAMWRGRIAFAGTRAGYGLTVVIDHGGGYETLYAHMSELRVRTGDRVGNRDVIGAVGRTGNASGAHLHFEVRHRGHALDPVPLLGRFPAPR